MKHIFVMTCLVIYFFSFNVFSAVAGSANRQVVDQWLRGPGIIRGGSAESFMSLIDVRRSHSIAQKTERLIFDWGNRAMQASSLGGYYQVEYLTQPERVIVNFAQTLNTKFEASHIHTKLGSPLYIKEAQLEFDPISQSQNLTLILKKPLKLRVASYPAIDKSTTAKLVIDLVE